MANLAKITEENKPFENFISGAKVMIYFHNKFVYQFLDILDVVTGKVFVVWL